MPVMKAVFNDMASVSLSLNTIVRLFVIDFDDEQPVSFQKATSFNSLSSVQHRRPLPVPGTPQRAPRFPLRKVLTAFAILLAASPSPYGFVAVAILA